MSRVSSRKQNGNDAKKGKLLQEIEVLSKNIYLEKNLSKGSDVSAARRSNSFRTAPLVGSNVSSRCGNDGTENKDKKCTRLMDCRAVSMGLVFVCIGRGGIQKS
ncbi:hypothetical protein Droror1_Dr00003141 [Drosera rotundifolia]